MRLPHGKPLHCPKCPEKHYFGRLKLPGEKDAPCPNCGTTLVGRRNGGQTLVEFALVLPLLLFMILGTVEAGFLLIDKARQDRSTAVVAAWAANHPNSSWNAVASKELPGCDVEVSQPLPDLVEATSRCLYQPKTGLPLFDQIPVASRETAVSPTPSPPASAAPSLAPDASPSS